MKSSNLIITKYLTVYMVCLLYSYRTELQDTHPQFHFYSPYVTQVIGCLLDFAFYESCETYE